MVLSKKLVFLIIAIGHSNAHQFNQNREFGNWYDEHDKGVGVCKNKDCDIPEADCALEVGKHTKGSYDLDNDERELIEKGWRVKTHEEGPWDVYELSATLRGPGTMHIRLSSQGEVNIYLDDALAFRGKDDENNDLNGEGLWIQYNPNVELTIKGKFLSIYEFEVTCPVEEDYKADCVCRYWMGGCYIDYMFPPPRGYKCHCTPGYIHKAGSKYQSIEYCEGKAVRCASYNQTGCHGCAQEECCDVEGDCDGYNHGGNGNKIPSEIVVIHKTKAEDCPAQKECPPTKEVHNDVDIDVNISDDQFDDFNTDVDVDVTFDKDNGTVDDDQSNSDTLDDNGDENDSDVEVDDEDVSGDGTYVDDQNNSNATEGIDSSGNGDVEVEDEDASGNGTYVDDQNNSNATEGIDSSGDGDVDVEDEDASGNGTYVDDQIDFNATDSGATENDTDLSVESEEGSGNETSIDNQNNSTATDNNTSGNDTDVSVETDNGNSNGMSSEDVTNSTSTESNASGNDTDLIVETEDESVNGTSIEDLSNANTTESNASSNDTNVIVDYNNGNDNETSVIDQTNSTTTDIEGLDSIETENGTSRIIDDFDQDKDMSNKLHDFIGSLFNFNFW